MRYGGQSLQQAADTAIRTVDRLGATGGVIAVDRRGAIAITFNSEGMYRGYISSGCGPAVAIY